MIKAVPLQRAPDGTFRVSEPVDGGPDKRYVLLVLDGRSEADGEDLDAWAKLGEQALADDLSDVEAASMRRERQQWRAERQRQGQPIVRQSEA